LGCENRVEHDGRHRQRVIVLIVREGPWADIVKGQRPKMDSPDAEREREDRRDTSSHREGAETGPTDLLRLSKIRLDDEHPVPIGVDAGALSQGETQILDPGSGCVRRAQGRPMLMTLQHHPGSGHINHPHREGAEPTRLRVRAGRRQKAQDPKKPWRVHEEQLNDRS
jgi:hypothetical protein